MTVPCLRVYDKSLVFFVDVYWYKSVSKEQAKAKPSTEILLPKDYDFTQDLLTLTLTITLTLTKGL